MFLISPYPYVPALLLSSSLISRPSNFSTMTTAFVKKICGSKEKIYPKFLKTQCFFKKMQG